MTEKMIPIEMYQAVYADRDAALTRADDLSRTVAAMGDVTRSAKFALIQAKKRIGQNLDTGGEDEWAQCDYAIREIDVLDMRPDVVAERGRWVTLKECDARHLAHRDSLMRDMDRVAADICTARAQRDAAIARADTQQRLKEIATENLADALIARDGWKARAEDNAVSATEYQKQGEHTALVERMYREAIARAEKAEAAIGVAIVDGLRAELAAAERARDELGIQLAAAQERLRLAMAAVFAADNIEGCHEGAGGKEGIEDLIREYQEARAALDAVPGDALAPTLVAYVKFPPSPAGVSGQPSGLRAVAVSHLEALGIDTDNVKEKA